jgi:hypothetical protein
MFRGILKISYKKVVLVKIMRCSGPIQNSSSYFKVIFRNTSTFFGKIVMLFGGIIGDFQFGLATLRGTKNPLVSMNPRISKIKCSLPRRQSLFKHLNMKTSIKYPYLSNKIAKRTSKSHETIPLMQVLTTNSKKIFAGP